MGARMIDCLVARAASHALSLASLDLHMRLAGSLAYQRTIRPAIPTPDRKFLLKLLQLEIAAHPPQAAVLSFTLTAQAGQSSKVQLGLFAPQTPEPSRLDVTIARLKAIAGEDRVGSPVLEDSHRPGSFRMESFVVASQPTSPAYVEESRPRVALRRMRPPMPVRVQLFAFKPVAFGNREESFKVAVAYGPWRTSGCWWSTEGWDAEEWDILAETCSGSTVACLLVRNCAQNAWSLEAFYD
jgi:protein ImuB